jgi:CBS domain-containing protein
MIRRVLVPAEDQMQERPTAPQPSTVADVMRRDVVTVSPSASIRELARLLREHQISGVPVVEGGRLVGTVSVKDILWLSEAPSLFAEDPVERARAAERLDQRTVGEIMSASVFGVGPDVTLAELATFFARSALGRAIVQRDGVLLGLVSATDLIALIAAQPVPGDEA